ncbi:MAG TPA: acyl-CoA dehydrogenase family protein [Mycobacteriales bacterium]|nr:acyl-CoA dehydrogenase family protein [Mycobacteriales bacterium]
MATMGEVERRATAVADGVLAATADEIDRDGSFPKAAVDGLREAGLMAALIPVELGGMGASMSDVARSITALGRQCASTAMIFAMHQIQVACLVRHGSTPELLEYLREISAKQLLLASATTEIGIGGDVRTSSCFVERVGDHYKLSKNAPVISYGDYADAILATARRDADAAPNDQVIVVCRRDGVTLQRTTEWDALGFRGTCSHGYMLDAEGPLADVVPVPYGDVSSRTMLPVSHMVWSSVWLGVAEAAVNKARKYVRSQARSKPGVVLPAATRLAELVSVHQQLQGLVLGALARWESAQADPEELEGFGFTIAMNTLKVAASEIVVDVVNRAMQVIGISAYRMDSQYCLGRHLRDAHGAALMVNNDRITQNNAQLLLVAKES